MDDTLFPEFEFVISGYAAVAADLTTTLDVPASTIVAELAEIFATLERPRAFNTLLARYGREDLVQRCITTYRQHQPDIHLTVEADHALGACLRHGPVGLVTDGPEDMQAAKVAALGLEELGVVAVFTDRLGGRASWKPSPAGLIEVARLMDAPTCQLVYVADNPLKDFAAATAAGMPSVRYRTGWQMHAAVDSLAGSPPTYEIDSLAQLPALLRIQP